MAERKLEDLLSVLFQAHPWHGIEVGPKPPGIVNAFIELVPTDAVKYELDKQSGHLRLDRPHRYSSLCPTPYGFIPQTYSGRRVAERCSDRTGHKAIQGDGDPMDICVLTEKTIPGGNLLVHARPIGGLRMVDGDEADDKIIAVLEADLAYGNVQDIREIPTGLVERLQHYFLSYKQLPGVMPRKVEIAEVYDRAEAEEVILRSHQDYRETYGDPGARVEELRRLLAGG
jgi:inorganic pyrophosphatase